MSLVSGPTMSARRRIEALRLGWAVARSRHEAFALQQRCRQGAVSRSERFRFGMEKRAPTRRRVHHGGGDHDDSTDHGPAVGGGGRQLHGGNDVITGVGGGCRSRPRAVGEDDRVEGSVPKKLGDSAVPPGQTHHLDTVNGWAGRTGHPDHLEVTACRHLFGDLAPSVCSTPVTSILSVLIGARERLAAASRRGPLVFGHGSSRRRRQHGRSGTAQDRAADRVRPVQAPEQ